MAKNNAISACENRVETPIKDYVKGSTPFSSTLKTLIVSRINIATDELTDQTDKPENLKTKWEGPFLYEPPGGDLKKDWFVWIKYEHPQTGKFERFRYNVGFNQFKTKTERREYGRLFKIELEEFLKNGWTPFEEYRPLDNLLNKQKTVSACIDKYLSEITVRRSTLHKYSLELNLFKGWLIENGYDQILLNDIKKIHVTDFLNHFNEKRKWKPKTYNHYLTDITTFFKYFYDNYDDYIDKVPTTTLNRPPVNKPGNKAFNDWQFKRLKEMMKDAGDDYLYTYCSFIYYAGLRSVAEGNKIKAGDFNFKQNTLRVESGNAKNRRTEYIPIYPDFKELLYELGIDRMNPDFYVFARDRNGGFLGGKTKVGDDYFRRLFKPYKEALELNHRDGIYCYKHTRAVHLGEDGEDLFKIMKLFRHKDLATTMIYMRDLGIDMQKTEFKKGRRF